MIPNADENVEQRKLSYIAHRNAKWYHHCGKHFGSFSKS
jgi:hypothetical protein